MTDIKNYFFGGFLLGAMVISLLDIPLSNTYIPPRKAFMQDVNEDGRTDLVL